MGIRSHDLFDYGESGDVADILSFLARIEGLLEDMAGGVMKLSAILAPLLDAKADHEMIRRTIIAYEAEQTDALAKRRESDAKRQAEKRKRDESHVTSRDVTVTVSSHASASPAPDLENKQTNKPENKEERKQEPAAHVGFSDFWALFPNKVGKRDAEAAFLKALHRADLATILAGLRRYAAKTDDRPWCNPTTFLNQDRWDDQPADAPPRRSTAPPPNRKRNYADVAMDRVNGHGPKGIFSTDGDVELVSPGSRESRPDDGNIRGGVARRYLPSNH